MVKPKPKGSLSKSSTTSESVTLRPSTDVLSELREEAKVKQIRLNTLATQIFRTHIEYGSMASRVGMISVHKSLPMLIMERMSEGEILKLSEHIAKNEMKNILLLMKKRYDVSAFVDFIESWARVSGFEYRHGISDVAHSFVIRHDMGMSWSVYITNVFKLVFSDMGAKRIDVQSTNNTVTFSVDI